MEFKEYFEEVRARFIDKDVSEIPGKLAIQINLTNEAAGTFYIEVNEGILSIEPYEYNDRNVEITVSTKDFQKIIDKKLDPVLAFTLGKMKVDGDVGKALELKKFF